jgi:hypothetical protein
MKPGFTVLAALLFSSPAWAQQAPAPGDKITYDAGLFLWLPDLAGDAAVGGAVTEIDAGDGLDGAGTLHFEVWSRDESGGFLDLNWTNFEKDTDFPGGEGSVDVTMAFVEVAAATRWRRGDGRLDLFLGLRLLNFATELSPPGGGDEDESRSYLDPMLGVRIGWDLATWLSVSFRIDVAGFGVGTELTGNFVFMAGFNVTEAVTVAGGWKSMAIEIDEDTYDLDLVMRGPVLGVTLGY